MARLVLRPAIPATPAAEDCRRGENRIAQELPLLPYASCSVRRLLLHRWHAPERPVQQQVRCPPPPPAGCSRGTGAVRDWVAGSYAAQACALAAAAASAASCLNCQGTCRADSTDTQHPTPGHVGTAVDILSCGHRVQGAESNHQHSVAIGYHTARCITDTPSPAPLVVELHVTLERRKVAAAAESRQLSHLHSVVVVAHRCP